MKNLEQLTIEDLAKIIRTEPLIAGENPIIVYSKKQREELKDKLIEIANLVLDFGKLEYNFVKENLKRKNVNDNVLEIIEEIEKLFGL